MYRTALGIAALAIGVYAVLARSFIVGGVALIFGAFMSATGFTTPSGRQISGKINSLIYKSLRERGIDRIREGKMHVDERSFIESLDRIRAILGNQSEMPELGFDSLFIHCQSEAEAERNLSIIRSSGLTASVIQNKRDWQIKVEYLNSPQT
ncbi:MAG: hypothetical protein QW597_04240 [Thermoplasmataceae archaeon]